MVIESFRKEKRSVTTTIVNTDFVVAGGGITGVCAAIAAARGGLKVALVQNRPVLGGNASSEVRVWMLGATSHMGNNNRWAREGGIIDEIVVENTYKNKEGNPIIFDTILLDKVLAEKNISLFLNTEIFDLQKRDEKNVSFIRAYNSLNETEYTFEANYFCDATGDGLLAYLAGATYRVGAEDRDEFNEKFAPNKETYGEMLGHSILFYYKEAKEPVKYVAPDFVLSQEEIEKNINRIKNPNYFNSKQFGCKYWWIEYGGRLDTIADTEEIKYELLKVVYGIWNYIKNSGKYPEAENMTLEWVGNIPGKRESRRFVGQYMIRQHDLIEQQAHPDVVAFGGWSLDLHPSDGVFSSMKDACSQWHSKGVYQIPYRCYITPDLDNVFIGGRILSSTHVALASTRVMMTAAVGGQAIGTAAAICSANNCTTAQLLDADKMKDLQVQLIKDGAYLPQSEVQYEDILLNEAEVQVSSELQLSEIPFDGKWKSLSQSAAQMLPIEAGKMPRITVKIKAKKATTQLVELRISSKYFNHTPDVTLETLSFNLEEGENDVALPFGVNIPNTCYVFVCFMKNQDTEILSSQKLVSGLVSVFNKISPEVSNWGKQESAEDIGVESFEFWCPERRPEGQNIAMKISPALNCFAKENLLRSPYRPVEKPNAWVADLNDKKPTITLTWKEPKKIKGITLFTDTDYDHAMESVQWGHYDRKMPFCVDEIIVGNKEISNYQTKVNIKFDSELETNKLTIELKNSSANVPVALFGIHIDS
ncbi:FAD-dependent oxidoreductase [Dysgonomonas sp. 520]|uniref:FAD-dependent oxidoreductase n=1 Tax=Dysgonomonas sp. 520 TaxID=2302931 RepID=UPI0013D02405|nr:FAD-dependent oxidoreductase [Dysgonomonas sp. 520]NDW08717.1 FAD-dependent oxidoreductase [Dysgonomonas sp. 520]